MSRPVLVLVSLLLALFALCGRATVPVCDTSYPYRSINGSCNNLVNILWGVGQNTTGSVESAGVFIRLEEAEYENITARLSPREAGPNPVIVGVNRVAQPDNQQRRSSDVNVLFTIFGQLVTHDTTDTAIAPFDPFSPNNAAVYPDETGRDFTLGRMSSDILDVNGVPQQFNKATSYLDMSPLYGTNDVVAAALRTGVNGLLKVTTRDQFIYNYTNFPNLDVCTCINVTTGQPWLALDPNGNNVDEIYSMTIRGFAPEPYPPLGKCVSPAGSFGPGAVPGVYKCVFAGPPQRFDDVQCSINYTAISNPSRNGYVWRLPAGVEYHAFVSDTFPPVPWDRINSQTQDPSEAVAGGDARNSENHMMLVIMQMFLREHNARARTLKQRHPTWTDETIYQEARKWVIAVWQQIVHKEYLPLLIGSKAYKKAGFEHEYEYDPEADPRVNNAWSTAAFRLHSMVPKVIFPVNPLNGMQRIVANATQVYSHMFGKNNPGTGALPYFHLPFAGAMNAFGYMSKFYAFGASQMPAGVRIDESIMAGIINQKSHAPGHYVDRGLADLNIASCFTPHLFVSVPALTTFRGRIHGIPNYNELRRIYSHDSLYGGQECPRPKDAMSLDPIECFLRLTEGNTSVAQMLKDTYGRIDKIDPWFGLMIEQETSMRPEDAVLTKTSIALTVDQMTRLRDGDRFWYENDDTNGFSTAERNELKARTLRSLIAAHFPALASKLANANEIPNVFLGRDDFTTV